MACDINAIVSVSIALPYFCVSKLAFATTHGQYYVPQTADLGG